MNKSVSLFAEKFCNPNIQKDPFTYYFGLFSKIL